MAINETAVYLTDRELVALGGLCRAKVQAEVNRAILRLESAAALNGVPDDLVSFVTRIIEEARESGRLVLSRRDLRYCGVCDSHAGHEKYKRRSRYHEKGDLNYDKPLTIWGVGLSRGSALDCCKSCWDRVKPLLADALKDVRAEIDESVTGHAPQYKRHSAFHCIECGWRGHEGEMGRLPCLMSAGTYPGECPGCGAKNLPLGGGSPVGRTGEFVILEVRIEEADDGH